MTTAQEQRVAAKYTSGLSWKRFDATAEGQRLAAEAERERAADAKLIAAAPELLAACEALAVDLAEAHAQEKDAQHYGDNPKDCLYCRHLAEAHAAIAKAKRKTPSIPPR